MFCYVASTGRSSSQSKRCSNRFSGAVPQPPVARGDADRTRFQDGGYVLAALEQSACEDGEIQDLRIALGYLAIGESRQYLDEAGFGPADELEAPLDGPRVYGEEAMDRYEA